MPNPIRVFLVDDSPTAIEVLRRALSSSPDIIVAGTARNGRDALERIPAADPSVVCTDIEMPVMDGLELTRTLLASRAIPVLIVSSFVQPENQANVFRALEAGAIDVLAKPRSAIAADGAMDAAELIEKIRVVSGVVPLRRGARLTKDLLLPDRRRSLQHRAQIVGIGASLGGPNAIGSILRSLPSEFPAPILCVQHIGAGFLESMVAWLDSRSPLRVRVAAPGELPLPGNVYFPEEGKHLLIGHGGRLMSSEEARVCGHRPSVNVTFQSIARHYGPSAIGVLLTGMGEDGAEGMKAITTAGALTIAQDEQTSAVFGMPGRAIELGAARWVLPLERIGEYLVSEVLGTERV